MGESTDTRRRIRRGRVLLEEFGLIVFLGGILAFGGYLILGGFGAPAQNNNPGATTGIRVAGTTASGKVPAGPGRSSSENAATSAPASTTAAAESPVDTATRSIASAETFGTADTEPNGGTATSPRPHTASKRPRSGASSEAMPTAGAAAALQTKTDAGKKRAVSSSAAAAGTPQDNRPHTETKPRPAADSETHVPHASGASATPGDHDTGKSGGQLAGDAIEREADPLPRQQQTDPPAAGATDEHGGADHQRHTPDHPEPAPAPPQIEVIDATFAYAMARNRPQGRVTYIDYWKTANGRLYYYTRVNAPQGTYLVHEWHHEGEVVERVRFRVAGKNAVSISQHVIDEDSTGVWRVYVRNTSGKVIKIGTALYK